MNWIRRNWRYLLFGLVALGALILLVILLVTRRSREAEKLQANLIALKNATKVYGLQQEREARKAELRANRSEDQQLSKKIIEAKRKTVEAVQAVSTDLTDVEIVKAFKDLGY
jgi:uncharacterized membrane-anchored protein YhcB (DUF1043 family)